MIRKIVVALAVAFQLNEELERLCHLKGLLSCSPLKVPNPRHQLIGDHPVVQIRRCDDAKLRGPAEIEGSLWMCERRPVLGKVSGTNGGRCLGSFSYIKREKCVHWGSCGHEHSRFNCRVRAFHPMSRVKNLKRLCSSCHHTPLCNIVTTCVLRQNRAEDTVWNVITSQIVLLLLSL